MRFFQLGLGAAKNPIKIPTLSVGAKNLPTQNLWSPDHAGSKGLGFFLEKKMLKVGRDQNLDSLNLPFLKFENVFALVFCFQFLIFKCLRVDPRTQGLEKYLCCFLLWKTNREEEISEHSKHLCNSWFLILFSSSRFPIEKISGICWIPKQLETASFQSPAYLSVKTEPLVLECSWFRASKL